MRVDVAILQTKNNSQQQNG